MIFHRELVWGLLPTVHLSLSSLPPPHTPPLQRVNKSRRNLVELSWKSCKFRGKFTFWFQIVFDYGRVGARWKICWGFELPHAQNLLHVHADRIVLFEWDMDIYNGIYNETWSYLLSEFTVKINIFENLRNSWRVIQMFKNFWNISALQNDQVLS